MRRFAFLVVAFMVFFTCSMSEEVRLTTDQEICPMDMEWSYTYSDFERSLVAHGGVFEVKAERLGEGESYSSSFGVANLVESGNYKYFPTDYYWIDIQNGSLAIGGYEANRVVSYFYGDTKQMYSVSYDLSKVTRNGDTVIAEDMYNDLKRKLTDLYGDPIEQVWGGKDGLIGGYFVTNHCSWFGSNSTAVTLRWTCSTGTYHGISDGDEIELEYGKTDSNDIMLEHKDRLEQEEMNRYQESLNNVGSDNSGL